MPSREQAYEGLRLSVKLHPYVVFLPSEEKDKILSAIFGSKAAVDLLRFSLKQGISKNIYQKDLFKKLNYSNKTIIENLKSLTKLGVLNEDMEKNEREGRIIWVKAYQLTDAGKWFALLLAEEKKQENKTQHIIGLWGLEIFIEGGEGRACKKEIFSKPFHPTFYSFQFSPPFYRALKASNQRLYSDSMSSETLGFRSSSICLKSLIVKNRGLASLSAALPDSKNSPIRLNCADWHTSRISLPLKPSLRRASSWRSTSDAIC